MDQNKTRKKYIQKWGLEQNYRFSKIEEIKLKKKQNHKWKYVYENKNNSFTFTKTTT